MSGKHSFRATNPQETTQLVAGDALAKPAKGPAQWVGLARSTRCGSRRQVVVRQGKIAAL